MGNEPSEFITFLKKGNAFERVQGLQIPNGFLEEDFS
jgi:hypothetical protein